LDVYNAGESDATVAFGATTLAEMKFTIKPKQLRRIRTDWHEPRSDVSLDVANGEGLVFDNLAYVQL
jgi:hypothetical protein